MDRVSRVGVLPGTWYAISSLPDPTARSGLTCLSPLPCSGSYRAQANDA